MVAGPVQMMEYCHLHKLLKIFYILRPHLSRSPQHTTTSQQVASRVSLEPCFSLNLWKTLRLLLLLMLRVADLLLLLLLPLLQNFQISFLSLTQRRRIARGGRMHAAIYFSHEGRAFCVQGKITDKTPTIIAMVKKNH